MEKPKFVSICTGAEVNQKEMKTRVFAVDWAGNLYEFNFDCMVWDSCCVPNDPPENVVNLD
jgi:coenzyme PQQ precursor peptide PqqA